MPLCYVLDENLSWASQRHPTAQCGGGEPVDFVCVGDPPDLSRGTHDPVVLLWAERAGRVLVSLDKNTLPGHLAAHLLVGHHSPGVFLVRRSSTIPQVLSHLVLVAHAGDPLIYADWVDYIP